MSYRECGHLRETVHEAGFNVVTFNDNEMVLEDVETGNLELWAKAPHCAGYAIDFLETTWEFVRTIS